MDQNIASAPPHASLEASQLRSLSGFIAHNITRRILELAEVEATRYYAFQDRHDRLFDPPLRPDDMIILARFEERIQARLEDALNTAAEYGLDVDQILTDENYPQLARFAKVRRANVG